jgi:hypothetical protein
MNTSLCGWILNIEGAGLLFFELFK